MSAWQWINLYGERPIEETLSALIFDNIFGRFPNLNVLVAEHGAAGCRTSSHMDKSRGDGPQRAVDRRQADRAAQPHLQEYVRVAPYPEDDIPWIVEDLGRRADCLVMGSDFPHAEGFAEPADFAGLLAGLSEPQQRQILRDNAEKLFGAS